MCLRTPRAVEADGGAFKSVRLRKSSPRDGALSPEAELQVEEAIALAKARSATSCEPLMAAGG
ncbi:hypothetical protein WN72_08250 [Bradyrhizobium arachidis]|uniref:Uncharacterized protein n=1 Tax=Bradyrhizobium arachidis TaxID=858423 RepID=A0AAE7NJ17_9BRAD|nr:hypothetical protein WN72_08250 [Bradyrhizobium arachidis]